ncbi:MAG: hypothetical protein L0Y57_15375 [Beijerinckiaceae bacterium]|nr:hypothetical protein [Beijerinckiaceae bacterium]
MGAVEHLKTLCCLGLKPESAMVAVTPLLHDIIPHDWVRMALLEPDATIGNGYAEHPEAAAVYRERLWRFVGDSSSPMSLWVSAFHAKGIGWTLHMQGRGWLESGWYHEIEAPLDSCWLLDAMIADRGQTFACLGLRRPRSARPFTVDDVQRLDRVRPWLAHAFRCHWSDKEPQDQHLVAVAGAPMESGQMILTSDEVVVFQTSGLEHLLGILAGEPGNYTRHVPVRAALPASILKLLQRITGAANGASNMPPRMQISTSHGVLTLEAKWLIPAGTLAEDVARDPKSCLISVTIELHEHALAHAARVLRESGATPAQMKVGIQVALGKTKVVIADELGLQLSSVASHTKQHYQTLGVHNAAELGAHIWLHRR